ncbi:hypothetical protein HGM15179_002152, partial [Zosterops borbonicus]
YETNNPQEVNYVSKRKDMKKNPSSPVLTYRIPPSSESDNFISEYVFSPLEKGYSTKSVLKVKPSAKQIYCFVKVKAIQPPNPNSRIA